MPQYYHNHYSFVNRVEKTSSQCVCWLEVVKSHFLAENPRAFPPSFSVKLVQSCSFEKVNLSSFALISTLTMSPTEIWPVEIKFDSGNTKSFSTALFRCLAPYLASVPSRSRNSIGVVSASKSEMTLNLRVQYSGLNLVQLNIQNFLHITLE